MKELGSCIRMMEKSEQEELALLTEFAMVMPVSNPQAIENCVNEVIPVWMEPGMTVYKQGDHGECAYFLTEGTATSTRCCNMKGVNRGLVFPGSSSSSSASPLSSSSLLLSSSAIDKRECDHSNSVEEVMRHVDSGNFGFEVLCSSSNCDRNKRLDTLVCETRCKFWKLDREAYERAIDVNGPLDWLRNQPILKHLSIREQKYLALHAQVLEATAGQVLARHGEANNKLFLLDHGSVLGVVRDGGISSLLSLQREGEVLWRFGPGSYFGEDSIVMDGQTCCTVDAVVESATARLYTIDMEIVRSMDISLSIKDKLRTCFISRLLHGLHHFNRVHSEIIEARIARNAKFQVLQPGQRFPFLDYCSRDLILVVTQGALVFCEKTGTHHKTVGLLEIGHSLQLEKLIGKSELEATADGKTCVLIAQGPSRTPKSTTSATAKLRKFESSGDIMSYERVEFWSPTMDGKKSKASNKRQAFGGCYEFAEIVPDSPCSTRSCSSPVQGKLKRSKNKFGESMITAADLPAPPPLSLSSSPTSKNGYAKIRKTKKQLQFLKSLNPVSIDVPGSSSSSHCKKEIDVKNGRTREVDDEETKLDIDQVVAVETTYVEDEVEDNDCDDDDDTEDSFYYDEEKEETIYRGTASPKKRKSGLVLSLDCLEKVDILGRGAFGTVNLVRDKHSNVIYALKQLEKDKVVAKRQVNRVRSEKYIMEKFGKHPFITNFIRTFRDSRNVYLLLEAGLGGDLFDLIAGRQVQALTMEEALFFSGQVVLALEFLHQHHVIYRDIKPENAVLCVDGYLRLTDFGMAKEMSPDDGRTYTLCGTPTFLAPEVLKLAGYGCPIDWWGFGVFMYEVTTGTFPFRADGMASLRSEHKQYEKEYPNNPIFQTVTNQTSDKVFVDLVKHLLHPDPNKRLGSKSQGRSAQDIKTHPFFEHVDWDALLRRDVCPPETVFKCVAASRVLASASTGNTPKNAKRVSFTAFDNNKDDDNEGIHSEWDGIF